MNTCLKDKKPEEIFDFKGNIIRAGNIVGMAGYGPYYGHQGFVVDPNSDIEGDGYCVAVFLGKEVYSSYFNSNSMTISFWDKEHCEAYKTGEFGFLLENKEWKQCPRIIFFRPEELVVQEAWNIKTLAERVFKDYYHSLYSLPKGISEISSDYMCFREDCKSVATKIALWNVWGSVYPMHVCDECFPKTNGWCSDNMPKLKKAFLLADGTQVPE